MAKKKSKSNGGLGFILGIISIVVTVLSFVSLAFNFLSINNTVLGITTTKEANLSGWMDKIETFQKADAITGWNVGKIFMIITLVLVGLLAVAMLVRLFMKNKFLDLGVKVLSILTIVSALVFFISTLVGCAAMSTDVTKYVANLGVYGVAFLSIISAVVAFFATVKSK